MKRKGLLACGILAALHYLAMNVIGPLQFSGYNCMTQTVSELSALGAPSRPTWVALGVVYSLLVVLFGVGVWQAAADQRALKFAGGLLVLTAVLGLFWPPMHLRGEVPTLTDTLHVAWTAMWMLCMLGAMGFSAAGLGRGFRWFTIVLMGLMLLFGSLTSIEAPNIPINGPTPTIGLLERINIVAYMAWLIVLAVVLMRREHANTTAVRSAV